LLFLVASEAKPTCGTDAAAGRDRQEGRAAVSGRPGPRFGPRLSSRGRWWQGRSACSPDRGAPPEPSPRTR